MVASFGLTPTAFFPALPSANLNFVLDLKNRVMSVPKTIPTQTECSPHLFGFALIEPGPRSTPTGLCVREQGLLAHDIDTNESDPS